MSVKEEDVKYIAKTDLGHDHTVIALLIVFFLRCNERKTLLRYL